MGTKEYSIRIKLDPTGAKQGGREVEDALDKVRGKAGRLEQQLRAAFAAVTLGAGLGQLAQLINTYDTIENRVRSVTRSQAEAAAVQEELFNVAQRSRTGLRETAELFHSLSEATRELPVSQRDVLGFVETVQKLQQAEGGDRIVGVFNQLRLALQQGVLEGRQLRTIIRDSDEVADALMRTLGVTSVTQLKRLADQGRITSRVVLDALRGLREEADVKFSNSVHTLSQRWTQLENAVTRTLGLFSRQSGLGDAAGSVLEFLTKNVEGLTRAVIALGVALSLAIVRFAGGALLAGLLSVAGAVGLLAVGIGALVANADRLPWVARTLEALGNIVAGVYRELSEFAELAGRFFQRLYSSVSVGILELLISTVDHLIDAFTALHGVLARFSDGTISGALASATQRLVGLKNSLIEAQVAAATPRGAPPGRPPAVDLDERRTGTQTEVLTGGAEKKIELMRRTSAELARENELLRLNADEREVIGRLRTVEERFQRNKTPLSGAESGRIEESIRALQRLRQQMKLVEDAATAVFKGMEDSIVNFVRTGKFEFSKFADSVVSDLVRIALQAHVTRPLVSAVTGFFGGGSVVGPSGIGAGGTTTVTPSMFGLATGGSFTVGGRGGADSQLVAFRATPGESVEVSQSGAAGRGGGNVTVQIFNQSGGQVETREERGPDGSRLLKVFVGEVKKSMADGSFDDVMGARYGASPRAKRR